MKRLISLISTEGKTSEQISKETKDAWEKYQNASREIEEKSKTANKEENQKSPILILKKWFKSF